ncbi:hypothetical protein B0H67DRAFT_585579 [Lasiosphaeris hirsuta]|uniref:Secreted protein n=1 Tax=Lasiosphaeris hirsuta TaxID=260670 RepID=A0AA40A906_9PEZI|nr:hypothetical protein B0H67DRAFT_585579 [Lasiosphaeris hirsuta]
MGIVSLRLIGVLILLTARYVGNGPNRMWNSRYTAPGLMVVINCELGILQSVSGESSCTHAMHARLLLVRLRYPTHGRMPQQSPARDHCLQNLSLWGTICC